MTIDEEGIYKIRGKNESDHNTIILSIEIENLDRTRINKRTIWNLKASQEKWDKYGDELNKRCEKASAILMDPHVPINTKYKRWFQEIDQAARITIGKTTVKTGGKEKVSAEVKKLQTLKKEKKKEIKRETDITTRNSLILQYKDIQNGIHITQPDGDRKNYVHRKKVKPNCR